MLAESCTLSIVMMNDTKLETFETVGQPSLQTHTGPTDVGDSYFRTMQATASMTIRPSQRRTTVPTKMCGMPSDRRTCSVPKTIGCLDG